MQTPIQQLSERAVTRARSMLGQPARYKLGAGNRDPAAVTPLWRGQCDCSGFVLWCLGQRRRDDRFPHYSGWINCDSALLDARRGQVLFQLVPWHDLRPGDVLVYPGRFGPRGPIVRRLQPGHMGLVVELQPLSFLPASEQARRASVLASASVIDCSAEKARRANGRAIDLRSGIPWDRDDARALRYREKI